METALIDCDGVLADFVTPALQVVARHTGVLYSINDFDDWDFIKVIRDRHGSKVVDRCYDDFHAEGFVFNLPVYPGAQEGMAKVRAVADTYIVTSPMHSRHWYYERTEWLQKHFGFKPKEVLHVSKKELTQGSTLLDDKPGNLEAWGQANPRSETILWDQPYNRKSVGWALRSSSWDYVADLLRNLK